VWDLMTNFLDYFAARERVREFTTVTSTSDNDRNPFISYRGPGKILRDADGYFYIKKTIARRSSPRGAGQRVDARLPAEVIAQKVAETEAACNTERARFAARDALWRPNAPARDEDLLPTIETRNRGSHVSLRPLLPELRHWREMLNPPIEIGAMPVAANDNERREDPEFIWSVPDRNPKPIEAEAWLALWSHDDQEHDWVSAPRAGFVGPVRIGRLRRAGSMWFNTTEHGEMKLRNAAAGSARKTYGVPLGAVWKWKHHGRVTLVGQDHASNREDETVAHAQNVTRANGVLQMLYELPIHYVTGGTMRRGKRFTAGQSRAMLAAAIANTAVMPPVTYLPPGLPCGSRDVAGGFLCVQRQPRYKGGASGNDEDAPVVTARSPVDVGATPGELRAANDNIEGFRSKHAQSAALLDLACAAGTTSMSDFVAKTGSADAGTNSRRLRSALVELRGYLQSQAA
jgi:hypothetical protein